MWPTSIAVSKRERAAAVRAGVALARLAQVGEARLEVAPGLDAAQVPAVAVRAGDELPVAQRLVGDDLALEADRAERAAGGAERGADLVVGRRARRPRRARRRASPARAGRRRARARARRCRRRSSRASPSTSRRRRSSRNSASASHVFTPGVSTSSVAPSVSGKIGARGTPRATSRSAAKSPFSQVTSVFSPAPAGARKSTRLAAAHHPGLRLDVERLRARSARRSGGRRRAAARSSCRGPSSSRSNE